MKRQLLRHVPIALACAVAVFAILNITAWYNLRDHWRICRRQGETRFALRSIQEGIESYRKEHKALPTTLAELPDLHGSWSNPNGPLADEWGRPYEYHVRDSSYEVFSYGRDGQPGGIGLDADLFHDGRNAEQTLPTFVQYFWETDEREVDRGGFMVAGLLAGVAVFITAFGSLTDVDTADQPRHPAYFLAYGLAIVLISSLVGAFLMPLHIPSGH